MRKLPPLLAVFVLSCQLLFAQVRPITGRVTDALGQPVPFSSIRIKGTKSGTSADADGSFTIRAKTGDVLVVSGTGITEKEVTVTEDAVLAIQVTRSSTALTEVVVTALGIQRQSKELGYATTKISTKELTQAKVTDISTGLAGKVSGLQINLTNNSVNPTTRIVLRGNRSITGNNQALLVLDGVPVDDPTYINKIDPEDVDNVTVLKGAVAAAIYGSKASNGVLIITTKHGTRGKPTITVSNTTSWERISYMPKVQTRFGSYGGEGFATFPDGTVGYVPYENQSYGPPYDGSLVPLGYGVPERNPDGTVNLNKLDTNFVRYSPIKNNIRDFFNTGLTNQANISFSSGDDRGTFYMGFQDVNKTGIVPNDKARRDNFRIGGSRTYGRFRAEYTASFNQSSVDIAGLSYNQTNGGVFSGRPVYFEVLNNPAHVPLTSFKDWRNNMFADPNGYFDAYATNPYWTIDNSRRKTNAYDLLGNLNLSFKVTEWLMLSDRLGITQTTSNRKYTRAGINFAPWAIADPWGAGNVPSSQGYLAPSEYDESFFEQRLNNDLIASFSKEWGDLSLKGLVGWNLAQRYQTDQWLEGDNLQFMDFYNISSVLGVPGYSQTTYKQRDGAFYGEATLGFKDLLFLHGSDRMEWNSTLDPSQYRYNYYGVDASLIFTQAIDALKNSKVLTYGKIRGGYTKVANINLGGTNPYGAYSLVNPFVPATGYQLANSGFPFGSLGGYSQSTTYLNPLIKPEITDEWEVGGELGFYNNRINLSGAYYQSKSKGQTLTAGIAAPTGFTQKVVNAGLVTNRGMELDLNVTPVKTKDVTWNVGISYAHYINKINELLPGVDELQLSNFANGSAGVAGGIYAVKGQPYPVIKTTDWVRDSANGKVIVDPVTGLPTLDPNEKVFGNTNPKDILGINTSVTYKGFTLSAVVDYRGGNYIMNSLGQNMDFTGVSFHSAENGRQRFIFPNSEIPDGTGKYIPNTSVAISNGGNIGGAGFWPTLYTNGIGTPYITNAAFWKLREVALNYEIPAKALSRASFIKRITVGIVGRNLLMLRPKSNFWSDPEFNDNSTTGVGTNNTGTGNAIGSTSEFQTPPTRLYGANISITF
ncbi:MAG: SusC/RagA family TonB-linked outer membrane protein [Bacteroidetes bacterium]|nr:SusC/RagA family TonB-linked outer membrane protein [Bacteroidota bacterium]